VNLQDFGAIGEAVGGPAVVATLLYVAYQFKQTAAIERAAGQRDLLKQLRAWWDLTLHHPELFDQIRRGLQDWDSLEPVEQDRVNAWAFSFFNLIEQVEYMHRDGFINEASHRGFLAAAAAIAATPGGRTWWAYARNVIGDDISVPIDEQLENRPASTPNWDTIMPHLSSLDLRPD
jgi:hypothetical protein